MKGIVLAGGMGSRLYPITKGVSKQLLPVYDKPMVYYPISVLMLAGIKEILIISTSEDVSSFKRLLGDGEDFGVTFEYCVQNSPDGIAHAFILGEEFIGNDSVCLILGDNIFYGHGLTESLKKAMSKKIGATVFGYHVKDPQRFGVVSFDNKNFVESIEEKPLKPKTNIAITGLYFYDNNVINLAKTLKPSIRGELEITDLNNIYIEKNELSVEILGRGTAWLDTGTHSSLLRASNFVESLEINQDQKIACLEEVAYLNGWITLEGLVSQGKKFSKTDYGQYLLKIAKDED